MDIFIPEYLFWIIWNAISVPSEDDVTPILGSAFPPLLASFHEISILMIVTLWFFHICFNDFLVNTRTSLKNKSNRDIVIHMVHKYNIILIQFSWMFIYFSIIILWGWISLRWYDYIYFSKKNKISWVGKPKIIKSTSVW